MFKDLALRVCITFNEATKIHVKLSLEIYSFDFFSKTFSSKF